MSLKTINILIVDDSPTMVALLRGILNGAGYKVVGEINNGHALPAAMQRCSPDIVCLDYNLPDCNGLELLKALKTVYPKVPVVMVTGNCDVKLELEAAEAGAAGFIHKPFTEVEILRQLSIVVQAQQFLARHDSTPHATLNKATALVADDSQTMRAMLTTILQDAGIQVLAQASNGKQVLELLETQAVDLVCLDIDMPVLDGLATLQLLHDKHPHSKVVMVTGSASKGNVLQAINLGARGFIVKPFVPDKVAAELLKILQRKD